MHNAENNFKVHVCLRCSKRTGKVDMILTGLGSALLRFWAMENTTSSKETLIIVRDTGEVVFRAVGKKDGFPELMFKDLGTCEDYGLSLEDLQEIKDDRFDEE